MSTSKFGDWFKRLLGKPITSTVMDVGYKHKEEASVPIIPLNRADRRARVHSLRKRCTRNPIFHSKRSNALLDYCKVTQDSVQDKFWQFQNNNLLFSLIQSLKAI